jgi:biopolymer transport protein ExbB
LAVELQQLANRNSKQERTLAIAMSDIIATIVKGGLVMIPLVLCSVISLAVTIERLLYWRRISSKQPVEQMLASVEQGKLNEALSDGQESPLPTARVLAGRAKRRLELTRGEIFRLGAGQFHL